VDVLTAATPALFKVPVPRLLLPSKKATVPVGTPPLPLTVALQVTPLPAGAGFCEELITVVLLLVMIWESTLEVLAPKALFPL
jgi:hypothetical protein